MEEATASQESAPERASDNEPPEEATSDLERQLDSLLSSMTRPGRAPATVDPEEGFVAPEPVENRAKPSGGTILAEPKAADAADAPGAPDASEASEASDAPAASAGHGTRGDLVDLDALLAAEADSAFGAPEPPPDAAPVAEPTPKPPPRAPKTEEAFLDLESLERVAAGLPLEEALPEPPEETPAPKETPPAPQKQADASTPDPEPEPTAEPKTKPETKTKTKTGPKTDRLAFLKTLPHRVASLLDGPVRQVAPALPEAVGPTPEARASTLRLLLGLAGVCLAGPGLAMVLVGLFKGG